MTVSFVRQLGAESGVQLNPLVDNSEIPTTGNEDQIFATAMRASRGRIDRAFKVNRSNVRQRLGPGQSMRDNELNEAYVHVREALDNGAYEAVVARLHSDAAVLSWIVVKEEVDGDPAEPTGGFTFEVSETEPETDFLMAIKHLECFNDGVMVEFRADEKREGGTNVANDVITLRLLEPNGEKLIEVTGSLDRDAMDDNGNSYYLPTVIEARTDRMEVMTGANATIDPDSDAYGYDSMYREKWSTSDVLDYFDEGGTAYEVENYIAAREKLYGTQQGYAYIASCGSEAPGLIAELASLSFDTNRQLRIDVPGDLDVEGAIAFVEQMNLGSMPEAHLLHAFWAPLRSIDPTGINGKRHFGTATLNIAMACGRNARVNAKGFAPKNYPIAGREWPVSRQGIVQTYSPNNQELNALARAKINPVIFENYSGGGRYVFRDSLTSALVDSSLKKLIAVSDMSTSIDDAVTRFGKDILQLPMSVAIKKMRDFLTTHFEQAQASDWLVPSDDPAMNGAAWRFEVQPNEQRPYELMDVRYWLRYDGTTRQIHVTQTLSR
ncbi:hypothetical protein L0636_00950 [Halomonas janggokensis]|uniref:Uncharacterized protein n=1 Tax=Vreelandella janggokensis TaxID=370767 RepID=A0ABT4IS11_9GAMM|nr:hypothetical protein [Halomonas janggokensis]MCZ0926455.1 hypothetical protein [Halomonas janggokensis]MCZ0928993.1 hypothetical protein [Halomonas janggokensis]